MVIGTVSGIAALQWIDYPTQVIAKACKPIPVMLLGVLIGKRSYGLQKYLFVILIVFGVAMFMYKETDPSKRTESAMIGIYLVSFSLFMDGIQGGLQDRLASKEKILSMDLLLYVNFWGACSLIAVLAVTGEGRDFISFLLRHPQAALHILMVLIFGTAGQALMQSMIVVYGSLPTSLVTTSRKLFTVLISSFALGNHLTIVQWVAATIVFGSLLLDSIFGKKKDKLSEQDKKPEKPLESLEAQ